MPRMRDLQKIFWECIEEVKSLNIPTGDIKDIEWMEIDNAWGKCHREWMDDHFEYSIGISDIFSSDNIHINELRSIICHEMIHTCPRCWQHNKTWVKYALKIDEKYGYGVATYKNEYNVFNSQLSTLHQMVCPNCGGKLMIKKESVWEKVKDGSKAYCGWCRHEMSIEF